MILPVRSRIDENAELFAVAGPSFNMERVIPMFAQLDARELDRALMPRIKGPSRTPLNIGREIISAQVSSEGSAQDDEESRYIARAGRGDETAECWLLASSRPLAKKPRQAW